MLTLAAAAERLTISRRTLARLIAAGDIAAVQEMHQKMADEWGVPLQSLRSNFNPAACYCACGTGGPCEHKWDGEGWESEDGCGWSATCSRCGCTAMSHDMRNAP